MQEMENGKIQFSAPVSKDRVISKFPKVTTGLKLTQHLWSFRMKMSKVVVVGDLYVGKTCLINRFCKDLFDRDYKATIGVDFEIERFELSGVPYTLQIWDTAGQEKFKCIASTYYRGAQAIIIVFDLPSALLSTVIIIVFDLADIRTLEHTRSFRQKYTKRIAAPWSCIVFLIGTKKDLLSSAECQRTERDAIKMAAEMHAEFWSVSSKTGENVREFFFRVAALAFEETMLQALERGGPSHIGARDLIRIDRGTTEEPQEVGEVAEQAVSQPLVSQDAGAPGLSQHGVVGPVVAYALLSAKQALCGRGGGVTSTPLLAARVLPLGVRQLEEHVPVSLLTQPQSPASLRPSLPPHSVPVPVLTLKQVVAALSQQTLYVEGNEELSSQWVPVQIRGQSEGHLQNRNQEEPTGRRLPVPT
ncbi:hypothetical protein JZ751_029703, partial [Albula glossodonta]